MRCRTKSALSIYFPVSLDVKFTLAKFVTASLSYSRPCSFLATLISAWPGKAGAILNTAALHHSQHKKEKLFHLVKLDHVAKAASDVKGGEKCLREATLVSSPVPLP